VSATFRRVVVDIAKLRDYCLSDHHLRGRHKARVFRSRLGIGREDAEALRQRLLEVVSARTDQLTPTEHDRHGQRYILDFGYCPNSDTCAPELGHPTSARSKASRSVVIGIKAGVIEGLIHVNPFGLVDTAMGRSLRANRKDACQL